MWRRRTSGLITPEFERTATLDEVERYGMAGVRERGWRPPMAGGAAITLVKGGAVTATTTGSVAPAFGQATQKGNLAVALVGAGGASGTGITGTGWLEAATDTLSPLNADATIWYKPNIAASEAAPSFTGTASTRMAAVLAEFAAVAPTSPLDQSGYATGAASPITVTAAGPDATDVDLELVAVCWHQSTAAASTLAQAVATPPWNDLGQDAGATGYQSEFSWRLRTSGSTAAAAAPTNNSATVNGVAAMIATFKPALASDPGPIGPRGTKQAVARQAFR